MSDYILQTERLCCRMGKRYLLKDITWQVKRGEHWVVYGMNGSGKTTLLSIAAGFKHFTAGTLRVFGENYQDGNVLALRQKIGFVSSAFFDGLYARESILDIVLSAKTGGLSVDSDVTLADAVFAQKLLTSLGLGDKLTRQFDMLSKGERQNVLIARALLSRPQLLILDEPCNGLDVYNRAYLFNTLETLAPHVTLIYVTHYTDEITPLFGKTLLLKNGAVFAQGDTADLFTDETISRLLGYPVTISRDDHGRLHIKLEARSDISALLYGGDRS